MYKSKGVLPLKYRKMCANSLTLPYFDYLDIIWNKEKKKIQEKKKILYLAQSSIIYHKKYSSITL